MIEEDLLVHPINGEILDCTIGEAVQYGTFSMYLPYQWAPNGDGLYGETPKNPLTIYASLDVTQCGDCVTMKTTMRGLLLETYDLVKNTVDGKLNEDAQKIFKDFRDSLKKEVEWIDKLLEKNT
jgi:hypothetical protein